MKKYISAALAVITVLSLLACAVSCGKKYEFEVSADGYLVNEKNGVTYVPAPDCYEAVTVSETVFAEQGALQFFEIDGADSSKFICDAFGTVYYSSEYSLPSLADMSVSYVDINNDGSLLRTVSDASLISSLKDAYAGGREARNPSNAGMTPKVNLRMRFVDYEAGICFVIAYYEYADDYIFIDDEGNEINYGKCFFYNRALDACVAVDGLPDGILTDKK